MNVEFNTSIYNTC